MMVAQPLPLNDPCAPKTSKYHASQPMMGIGAEQGSYPFTAITADPAYFGLLEAGKAQEIRCILHAAILD